MIVLTSTLAVIANMFIIAFVARGFVFFHVWPTVQLPILLSPKITHVPFDALARLAGLASGLGLGVPAASLWVVWV